MIRLGESWLWNLAVSAFTMGLWLTAKPVSASTGIDGTSFTWGQVCVLVAVASAWGDMRSQVKQVRKDVDGLIEDEKKRSHKEG